jgi:hypothetical protein
LYRAADAADKALMAELQRLFGADASTARHQPRGKGEAGSILRGLFDAKIAADNAWMAS